MITPVSAVKCIEVSVSRRGLAPDLEVPGQQRQRSRNQRHQRKDVEAIHKRKKPRLRAKLFVDFSISGV